MHKSTNYKRVSTLGKSKEETLALYSSWAQDYEKDLHDIKVTTPKSVATVIMEIVKPNEGMKIIDMAAGTGFLTESLLEAGLNPSISVDALDASEEMLKIAQEKKIYDKTFVSFIGGGAKLPVEKDHYDLVMMAGAFAPGHVPIDGWDSFLDVVKPGGHAVCSLSDEWLEPAPEYLKMDEYIERVCKQKGAIVKERRVCKEDGKKCALTVWVVQKNLS